MRYEQAFFERLKSLMANPEWELAFERPDIAFEELGLIPAHCHSNVERWIVHHPSWRRVRGWLVSPCTIGLGFFAHSLAESPEGTLVDVTPYPDTRMRDFANRFIRHPGDDEEFDKGVLERWGQEGLVVDEALLAQAASETAEAEWSPGDEFEA